MLAAEQSTWTESRESFFNINWLMSHVQSVENYVNNFYNNFLLKRKYKNKALIILHFFKEIVRTETC